MKEKIGGQISSFFTNSQGLLTHCSRVWVFVSKGVRDTLLEKAHKSKLSIQLHVMKMYIDLCNTRKFGLVIISVKNDF